MNKTLKLIFIFFFTQLVYSQSKASDTIRTSFLTKEFENVNVENELLEKYSILKTKEVNSILGCIVLLNIKDDKIKKIAVERLRKISIKLFNEGTPVLLIYGMFSGYLANKENENLQDDNHLVYVSIAECVVSNAENIAHDVFNEQTIKLIKEKENL